MAITGAGLLGVALARRCAGRWPVRVLDARPVDPLLARLLPPAVALHVVDVRDERAVAAALCEPAPDCVLHTAALVGDRARRGGRLTWEVNVGGAVSTYRAARSVGARRFVLASSLAVYGARVADGPDERMAPAPRTAYGRSKLAAEQALAAEGGCGPAVTVARLAGLYGLPARARGGILAQRLQRLVEALLRRRRARVPGALAPPREYLHVDDAAAAIVALLDAGEAAAGLFNVGSGEVADGARLGRALARALPGCDVTHAGPPATVRLRPLDCRRLAGVAARPAPLGLEEGVARLVSATAPEVGEPCA